MIPTDVSRSAEVAHLAEAATARFGRVDIWINDAGVIALGRFTETPLADHERVIDINLKGVVYGSYAALQRFRSQGSGVLINLGSVESRAPLPYQASYVATKHAVLGLDEALRQELRLEGRRGVQVVTVMPWAADTPIWDHAANYTGREPRAPSLDDADKVVRAVMAAALRPKARVAVGWKAKAAVLSEQLAPDLTENAAGSLYEAFRCAVPLPAPRHPAICRHRLPLVKPSTGVCAPAGVRRRSTRSLRNPLLPPEQA